MYTCSICGREVGISQHTCLCGHVLKDDSEDASSRFDYGMLLPWIPALGFILALGWVAKLDALSHPGTKLLKISGVTIILSALFSLLDAERLADEPAASPRLNFSGPTWFLLQILIWPLAFPLYLYAQYRKKARLRMWLGWIWATLFLLAGIMVWSSRAETQPFQTGLRARAESAAPEMLTASTGRAVANQEPEIVSATSTTLPVITPIPEEAAPTTSPVLTQSVAPESTSVLASPHPSLKPHKLGKPSSSGYGADVLSPGGKK